MGLLLDLVHRLVSSLQFVDDFYDLDLLVAHSKCQHIWKCHQITKLG